MRDRIDGGMYNRINEGAQLGELRVGMGATLMMYSDRKPYTVQKIVSDKRVIVTPDRFRRIDSNGISEKQEYEYESVPLVEGEPQQRCCHPYSHIIEDNGGPAKMCRRYEGTGTCDGCEHWRRVKPTNGVTLVKCKHGWKQLGADDYFILGVRERYEDPTF